MTPLFRKHMALLFVLAITTTSVFTRVALAQSVSQLQARDGQLDDRFGQAVAIRGDVALVGAPGDSDILPDAGSVYVFQFTDGEWIEVGELRPDDLENVIGFGNTIALDGNRVVIGTAGCNSCKNLAFIFERQDQTWHQVAQLTPGDETTAVGFGRSVALSADRVLIGANGAGYVFENRSSAWRQTAKLVVDDSVTGCGTKVALDNRRALVGCSKAHLFEFRRSVWNEADILEPGGVAYGLYGEIVVIGDYTAGAQSLAGQAFIFEKMSGGWQAVATLEENDNTMNGALFGASVSLHEDAVLIGAPFDGLERETGRSGAAYLYRREGGEWHQKYKLLPPLPAAFDRFGTSVDLDDQKAIVGSVPNHPAGRESIPESAYIFDLAEAFAGAESDRGFSPATRLDADVALPSLEGIYPNPFTSEATLRFALPDSGPVVLSVYDLLGREVDRLLDTGLEAGHHTLPLDTDQLPGGAYILRMATPAGVYSRPFVRLR